MMRSNNSSTTTLIAVALLLLILFVSVAYLTLVQQPAEQQQDSELVSKLLQNRQMWENSRPLSYRYVVHRRCSCAREDTTPFVATEERGRKTARYLVSLESSSGEFLSEPPNPVWITDIFDELIKAVEEDPQPEVEVSYDSRYRFPSSVSIRHSHRDAYVQYEIRDFEILEHRLPL